MKKKLFIGLILVIVVSIIAFIKVRSSSSSNMTLTPPLKRGNIIEAVYGIGTVMTNKRFDLNPGVNTIINDVYIQEGDHVVKNQKLVRLDEQVFIAPFDGVVTFFPYKKGEIVLPPNKILSVMDFSDRYLVVNMEQEGAIKVRRKQKSKINFDSIRDITFEGVVESVYSQDQNFLARIGISHLPEYILPSMTADVAIGIQQHNNVLLAPISALEDGFVTVGGKNIKKKKISVEVGVSDGTMVELKSKDLKEGDQLEIHKDLEK